MTYDSPKYNTLSRLFHWLSVLLIMVMVALGYGREFLPGDMRENALFIHMSLGCIILLMTTLRLLWRLFHRPPPLPVTTPAHEKIAAQGVHLALYMLLFVIPLSGWAMVTYFGKPLSIFGAIDIPPFADKDRFLGIVFKQWHGNLVLLFAALIGLHIAAALYHHIVKKDNILERMISFKK